MQEDAFSVWLQKEPLGQYLLAKEQAFYDQVCSDIFGLYALQAGLPSIPFLQNSRIGTQIKMGSSGGNLQAHADALPLDWRSVDLVLLPHTLELSNHPHKTLNEVRRVLVPDGKVIITGFNPASLWGYKKQLHPNLPYRKQMVGIWRLKDWLKLLDFEIISGQFMAYAPPFNHTQRLQKCQFLEDAGNRWWPHLAAVYAIVAVKRVYNVTPLVPEWKSEKLKLSPILGNSQPENKTLVDKKDSSQLN
ncbi:class I SAM-dependent methyltransferase [Neisseria sp. Ec49-e6-T10]|uniref:class I SAM-dependent methyltransferase n=1 Tax=Neisseria sp. Ec49-e6-T10 TaxID=3140744 RepID=UPI003EB9E476